jgi:riboflavin kinase/FMN adenylyltransferase
VYTFDPHPARVLAPALAPPLICGRDRKLELLAETGVDVCVVEPFTPELARLPPDEFLDAVLLHTLGARLAVVGYDFTYGAGRAGTAHALREFAARRGFRADVIDPVAIDGVVASSTKVRSFAALGQLEGVHLLLGRDHDVDGTVVAGAGRGARIGVPTANVAVDAGLLLPKPGVYAVRARLLDVGRDRQLAGGWLPGVCNLGTNPTFAEDGALSLEVHLLDFGGDLYGQRMRVAFARRIRAERRFEAVDALIAQIRLDVEQARHLLQEET